MLEAYYSMDRQVGYNAIIIYMGFIWSMRTLRAALLVIDIMYLRLFLIVSVTLLYDSKASFDWLSRVICLHLDVLWIMIQ